MKPIIRRYTALRAITGVSCVHSQSLLLTCAAD